MAAHKALPETQIGLLLAVAGPEMMAAAMPILRQQMKLTPEKLAAILHRVLNPDHIESEGDEALLRGVKRDTLRGYKQDGILPGNLHGGRHV